MSSSEGGYTCTFVEKPQSKFQSECPICLLVLRKPNQVSCCGYVVQDDNKPCPCCNAERFDTFDDKRLKRSLYDFKVQGTTKKTVSRSCYSKCLL